MKKNLFIAFEGIDGSGKSTQVRLLKDRLEANGHKVYTTCEPTDAPPGKMIRDIFNHRIDGDHRTIAALFVADRLHHILNKTDGMLKMLEDGYTVITDRYYFSSYAYQSPHIDQNWVIQANSLAAGLLRPDLNIYIDISPEISIERLNKGRTSIELYETLDNLRLVRNKYLELIDVFKGEEKVFVANGDQSPEGIANDIWDTVSAMLQ
ncbi:dTMP kinase [Mucilaginibacter sp. L3T2-6]|uniref:dTMP kinase n=1 Tax=Mucilaginibacter sp. L3T2-6 TaxID=3062491 RepID=UPI0026756272|nr:dTMP kinase [Mucilaginibacter sp. L3T2-6]MDO3640992.1 dTMP kinase [Mucilaginibacter sp. L3T2-6]MDV6213532.1 dTMP kinase [Mucilaginibacter sp. L3T2-6]